MKLQKVISNWPRKEELMAIAPNKDLNSNELLALESTSFYLPIWALSVLKGKNEVDKMVSIRATYNLLRGQDNGEDANLPQKDRLWLMQKFPYLVSRVVRIGENGGKLDAVLTGNLLNNIIDKLKEGARGPDDSERIFAEHLGRGSVFRELYSLRPQVREAIHYCIGGMATGMFNFIERGDIQTKGEFEDYCFDVAGSIGKFLNRLVALEDKVELEDKLAVSCGEYLQTINIIKGIKRDSDENRVFLPAEFHPGMAHSYLMTGIGEDAKKAREESFSKLVDIAESNFESALNYTISIPDSLSGYKAFVLMPFILGRETLQNMKNLGAEAVFEGKEDAVKIQYGLNTIPEFVEGMVTLDKGKRANEWLESYKRNPSSFPFDPNCYREWVGNWMRSKAA